MLHHSLPTQRLPSSESLDGLGDNADGTGVKIDGHLTQLNKDVQLVVCEQRRVQVMTLAGEPLQLVNIMAPKADLWGICAANRFIYVTDRGTNCVHVLAPPRMGAGADAAKSRYTTLTPRKGARAAQIADIYGMMSEVEAAEARSPRSPASSPRPEPVAYPTTLPTQNSVPRSPFPPHSPSPSKSRSDGILRGGASLKKVANASSARGVSPAKFHVSIPGMNSTRTTSPTVPAATSEPAAPASSMASPPATRSPGSKKTNSSAKPVHARRRIFEEGGSAHSPNKSPRSPRSRAASTEEPTPVRV